MVTLFFVWLSMLVLLVRYSPFAFKKNKTKKIESKIYLNSFEDHDLQTLGGLGPQFENFCGRTFCFSRFSEFFCKRH